MIHARMLYTYVKSPYNLYCDLFGDPDERDEKSEYQQMLFDAGKEHEKKVVEEVFVNAKEVEVKDREEGFKLLQKFMGEGVEFLHDFPVYFEDLTGNPDMLVKVPGKSKFGNYYYVVKEIKVAKNMKKHHEIQAMFYNYVVGKIQEYTPEYFYLINRDQDEFEIEYDEKLFLETLQAVRKIMDGEVVTPTYDKCDWPWQSYCDKKAIEERDVSLVPGVGLGIKKKLNGIGIISVRDLAEAKEDDLLKLDGFGPGSAIKMIRSAKAIDTGKAIKINGSQLSKRKTEIFLDLEGTGQPVDKEGLAPIDYLIGCLVRKNGKEEYKPFVAHSENDEEKMFNDFINWLEKQEDFVIYHWHHYEKNHLRQMCEKYKIKKDIKNQLMNSLVDLYKVATRGYAFPTYGNSIKDIAPWIGFEWRHKEVDAMESIAYYVEYVETGDKTKLQKVIDYNEDDVIATRVVKDWLTQNV
ncbi:MAG: TM0106 family RecB-like putative nuclease [Candidatus Nanoarchaeia archaeon]